MVDIQPLDQSLIDAIVQITGGNGWKNDPVTWAERLAAHRAGERLVLVASDQGCPIGYASLLWTSLYSPFVAAGIPEIHDIAVAQHARRRGAARALIAALEAAAIIRDRRMVGLGVGLYADYGPAQRLYASLGYLPDGRGITYRNVLAKPGASVPVDDDLIIWLVKKLS